MWTGQEGQERIGISSLEGGYAERDVAGSAGLAWNHGCPLLGTGLVLGVLTALVLLSLQLKDVSMVKAKGGTCELVGSPVLG